jgi:hypothetical protein
MHCPISATPPRSPRRPTRAFLILDEADSLLRDRALGHHSWELTQPISLN